MTELFLAWALLHGGEGHWIGPGGNPNKNKLWKDHEFRYQDRLPGPCVFSAEFLNGLYFYGESFVVTFVAMRLCMYLYLVTNDVFLYTGVKLYLI